MAVHCLLIPHMQIPPVDIWGSQLFFQEKKNLYPPEGFSAPDDFDSLFYQKC